MTRVFNPPRMRRRVTVVSSQISPLERLFVLKIKKKKILKIPSRTQRATEVKKIVGFSLKPLRCRDPGLLG